MRGAGRREGQREPATLPLSGTSIVNEPNLSKRQRANNRGVGHPRPPGWDRLGPAVRCYFAEEDGAVPPGSCGVTPPKDRPISLTAVQSSRTYAPLGSRKRGSYFVTRN
jgi:hypothetical protein